MKNQVEKTTTKEQRKNYHHLGSPDFMETEYNTDNCEYMISFIANASNTVFLGENVQPGDQLFLGLSEEDFENLAEQMINAIGDRLKHKLERYNEYKKIYYTKELDGNDFENSNWNLFKK